MSKVIPLPSRDRHRITHSCEMAAVIPLRSRRSEVEDVVRRAIHGEFVVTWLDVDDVKDLAKAAWREAHDYVEGSGENYSQFYVDFLTETDLVISCEHRRKMFLTEVTVQCNVVVCKDGDVLFPCFCTVRREIGDVLRKLEIL